MHPTTAQCKTSPKRTCKRVLNEYIHYTSAITLAQEPNVFGSRGNVEMVETDSDVYVATICNEQLGTRLDP